MKNLAKLQMAKFLHLLDGRASTGTLVQSVYRDACSKIASHRARSFRMRMMSNALNA